jgi:hypothetical protein
MRFKWGTVLAVTAAKFVKKIIKIHTVHFRGAFGNELFYYIKKNNHEIQIKLFPLG